MAADSSIKEAVVKTAVSHLLRTAKKNPDRTARNAEELACVLTHRALTLEEECRFLTEMAHFVRNGDEKQALGLVEQFFFPQSKKTG